MFMVQPSVVLREPMRSDWPCREHVCSAGPRVAYRCRHACLLLWSVATCSAVGTRTGAMSRCILVYLHHTTQYLIVWTRHS
jgi:hypothetical protein